MQRAVFESFIITNGGSVAKTGTNSCTHLVSSETGTKKCQDAAAKGVMIVDEQWIRDKVAGGGSSDSKGPATKKAAIAPTASPVATSGDDGVFNGITFNVAGTADFKSPLEELIVSNGGRLVPMGDGCHYLVRLV